MVIICNKKLYLFYSKIPIRKDLDRFKLEKALTEPEKTVLQSRGSNALSSSSEMERRTDSGTTTGPLLSPRTHALRAGGSGSPWHSVGLTQ